MNEQFIFSTGAISGVRINGFGETKLPMNSSFGEGAIAALLSPEICSGTGRTAGFFVWEEKFPGQQFQGRRTHARQVATLGSGIAVEDHDLSVAKAKDAQLASGDHRPDYLCVAPMLHTQS